MSGTFAKCAKCGRLNIYGARCVCDPVPPRSCDCKHVGNRQIIGPECRQAIRNAWAAVVNR